MRLVARHIEFGKSPAEAQAWVGMANYQRMWRDARVLAIGGGATEVMLEEVAKRY